MQAERAAKPVPTLRLAHGSQPLAASIVRGEGGVETPRTVNPKHLRGWFWGEKGPCEVQKGCKKGCKSALLPRRRGRDVFLANVGRRFL